MDAAVSSSSPVPLRFVIFPWLAFGHLLPNLELAERLALRGHRVSFVSTPGNIARLPALLPAAAPRVDLVALPLPRVDGLPDGAESTNSVPHDKFGFLFKAFDGLAAPFAEFLGASCADEARRPDWVIVDCFHYWAAAAAAVDHKVPCAMLLPSAASMAAARDRQSSSAKPAAAKEQPAAAAPRYESERSKRFFVKDSASGVSIAERFYLTQKSCTVMAMRSSLEWEPEFLPLVAPLVGKPVLPLGLLPPSLDGGRGGNTNGEHATVRWLDAQPPSSVLYVALGSEVPLSVEQVHELALGLELAGTRFLWALRKPSGGVPDGDVLPAGFQERTSGRGLVTTGWVPQPSILAHGAVGGFLTHCGRNSLIEGLLYGRPLVMLPIFGDQGPNARLMEGKKVGLQVPRDEHDGSFDRNGVAGAVRAVMLEEQTRGVFVANALEAQRIVAGGKQPREYKRAQTPALAYTRVVSGLIVADKELQERYIDEFIQQLRSYATALPPPPAET